MGVPESIDGSWVKVGPRLAALTVREVAICATSSDVHEEVEFLVEGSVDLLLVSPRVVTLGPATAFPEGLRRGVNIENNVVRGVQIGGDSILGPEETIDMEVISEGIRGRVLLRGLLITIGIPGGSPVEGGSELVVAAGGARSVVTARLHDVNLTRGRPSAICLILGKHPNGGPQEITLGELSLDLNLSILEVEFADGSKTGGLDGVDDVSRSSGVALTSVESVAGANGGGRSTPDVNVTSMESIFAEVFDGEGWLQIQDAILDERVGAVVCVPLELPVATTTHGDLV